jgi:hypothetical protein
VGKKKPAGCSCIEKVNTKLATDGLKLVTGFVFDMAKKRISAGPPQIEVKRIEKSRKKIPVILCEFCPFCGVQYSDA